MTEMVPVRAVPVELSPALADLARQAVEQSEDRLAPNTKAAYVRDMAAFSAWCHRHDLEPGPAAVPTVRLYVAHMAATKRPGTIRRALAAIKLAHERNGHRSPTDDKAVREQVTGIVRRDALRRAELGQPAHRQVKAATVDIMRRLVARLDRTRPIGVRDAALLLLGFAGGFRRSELVALRCGDVEWSGDGVRVTVRRSKTDQEGVGHTKTIPRGGDPDTCPVRALEQWHTLAGGEQATPLFRAVNRGGNIDTRPMVAASVALIIKRACVTAGIDEAEYSGHSLRRGMATTAARNGVHDRHIGRLGNWTPGSASMVRYIDDGSSWNDTAAGKLGL